MREEYWKPVKDYEGVYSVSNLGRIMRDDKKSGRTLKPYHLKSGYLQVTLSNNAKHETRKVARIVAESFIGKRKKGMQINHINSIKSNNFVNNLEYVTPSENVKHSYNHNLRKGLGGEKNYFCKLSEKDVLKIREIYKRGRISLVDIGKKFNVGTSNIHAIVKRKSWKHI